MCRELTLKEFKKFRVFRASVVNKAVGSRRGAKTVTESV